jgi:hypothetical protein
MSICPNCQQQIPEISELKFCPFCGGALASALTPPASVSEPSQPVELTPTPAANDEAAAPESAFYVPWEDRQRLGFLPAFSQTWSDSVFRPAEFFRRVPRTGNLGAALLYCCLIGITGSMLSLFWSYWFWNSSDMEKVQEIFGGEFNRDMLGYVAILVPVLTIAGVFIVSFIYHVCLMITGSSKNGFEATLRGYCYSYGPYLFAIIPQCGSFIAFFWQCFLLVNAWREMHESTTGRVVLAVLLPVIFCCGLTVLFALGLAGLITRGLNY